MRRSKLPAQSHLRCLRAGQGFNGATYEHPSFVSGARPVTYSCPSSPQQRVTRKRKPPPRSGLRNATPGPRQLSMLISPSLGRSSRGKSLSGIPCWERRHTRAESQTGPFRGLHPSIPGFVRTSVLLPPPGCRGYHDPSINVSTVKTSAQSAPQAAADTPPPGHENRRSMTTLNEDGTSKPHFVDSKDETRKETNPAAKDVRQFVDRVKRSVISRTNFNDATVLSGDAVVIFLRKRGLDDGERDNIYKRASEVFSREQIAETCYPWRRGPAGWAPPEPDKVRLKGEQKDAVPVFDSCDEIRAKIDAYLKQPNGPLGHQLCKVLQAQFKVTGTREIRTSQLVWFMAREGPSAGRFSTVYYAAYVFFEKLRIAEGRPKSIHRLEMERLHPRGLKFKCRRELGPRGSRLGASSLA